MSILFPTDSRKFLFTLLAWLVITTTTNAASIRGRERNERELKKSKNYSYYRPPIPPVTFPATTTSSTVIAPVSINPVKAKIVKFEEGCDIQVGELENCVRDGGGIIDVCKQCLVGLSAMNGVTLASINNCSNPRVDMCKECYAEGLAYYNCGTKKAHGSSISVDPTSGTIGGTTGGSTGGSTTGGYAPTQSCPFITAVSGDPCSVPGTFLYLECYYFALRCTCRADEKVWVCNPYP